MTEIFKTYMRKPEKVQAVLWDGSQAQYEKIIIFCKTTTWTTNCINGNLSLRNLNRLGEQIPVPKGHYVLKYINHMRDLYVTSEKDLQASFMELKD